MSGSTITNPGVDDVDLTIDGTSVILPMRYEPKYMLRQAVSETATGRRRLDTPYDGVGLPDVLDVFSAVLDWTLGDDQSSTIAFLERLRTMGGTHEFADWKQKAYRYTATAGQTVFYLPRPDAYSEGISGHNTSGYKAEVYIDNVAVATVNYGTVTSGTSVAAGEVSISTTATTHPTSGATVALFKFGTACDAGDIVEVRYYPLYSCVVEDVPTQPFSGEQPGREDKSLLLVEVN
jgi:hypothetical protein